MWKAPTHNNEGYLSDVKGLLCLVKALKISKSNNYFIKAKDTEVEKDLRILNYNKKQNEAYKHFLEIYGTYRIIEMIISHNYMIDKLKRDNLTKEQIQRMDELEKSFKILDELLDQIENILLKDLINEIILF